jgi:hypothetical protein
MRALATVATGVLPVPSAPIQMHTGFKQLSVYRGQTLSEIHAAYPAISLGTMQQQSQKVQFASFFRLNYREILFVAQ